MKSVFVLATVAAVMNSVIVLARRNQPSPKALLNYANMLKCRTVDFYCVVVNSRWYVCDRHFYFEGFIRHDNVEHYILC